MDSFIFFSISIPSIPGSMTSKTINSGCSFFSASQQFPCQRRYRILVHALHIVTLAAVGHRARKDRLPRAEVIARIRLRRRLVDVLALKVVQVKHSRRKAANGPSFLMRDIAPSLLGELGISLSKPYSLWTPTEEQKKEREALWQKFYVENLTQ